MRKMKNFPLTLIAVAILILIFVVAKFGIGPGTNTDIIRSTFPSVQATNLLGNKINVPENLQGEKIVLAIGFKKEHHQIIDGWTSIIDKFIEEDKSIKLYIMPVINKTHFFNRLWINNSMRFAKSDKEERGKVITVYTDQKKFANHLNIKTTQPYIIILDKNKNILKMLTGSPDATKLKVLNNVLSLK